MYQKIDGSLIVYNLLKCIIIDYNWISKREVIINKYLIKIKFFSILVKLVLRPLYNRLTTLETGKLDVGSLDGQHFFHRLSFWKSLMSPFANPLRRRFLRKTQFIRI